MMTLRTPFMIFNSNRKRAFLPLITYRHPDVYPPPISGIEKTI